MKKITTILFSIAITSFSFAQISDNCTSMSIASTEEAASAKDCILEISTSILQTPLATINTDFHNKLWKWIEKTPNYTIEVNTAIVDMCKGKNEALLTVFLASLAKAAISGTTNLHKEAVNIFIEYIKNEKNGVKQNGAIKKLIEAQESGDFKEYYE